MGEHPPKAGGHVRDGFATMVAEGTARWLYRDGEESVGICCDGPHVFGYSIDLDGGEHIRDFMERAQFLAPEGARLRITVELVPDGPAEGDEREEP